MKLIVKCQDLSLLERFRILRNNPILVDVLDIDFTSNPVDQTVIIDYSISNTSSDENEKDYCFNMYQFSREHSQFYIFPQSADYFIPLLNSRTLFNNVVKEVFGLNINVSGKTLDHLFQSFKLNSDPAKNIEYLKDAIRNSTYYGQKTNLGRLLYRDYRDDIIKLKDSDCNTFFYKFSQYLLNLIEAISSMFASIISKVKDGLLRTTIKIHKMLAPLFKSSIWRKLKNLFGSFDLGFLKKGILPGMFRELSSNFLFSPYVQKTLDISIPETSELDKRYYSITSGTNVSEYVYLDSKSRENTSILWKVLNVSDLLNSYESSIFYLSPDLLDINALDLSDIQKFYSYKNRQLATLADLIRLKNLVKKSYSDIDKLLDLELAKDTPSDYIDPSVYVFPQKLLTVLVSILKKYYIPY